MEALNWFGGRQGLGEMRTSSCISSIFDKNSELMQISLVISNEKRPNAHTGGNKMKVSDNEGSHEVLVLN